jgi:hypothetical protein
MPLRRFAPWSGSPGVVATVSFGPPTGVLNAVASSSSFAGAATIAVAPSGITGVLGAAASAATFAGAATISSGGLAPGTALLVRADAQVNRRHDTSVDSAYRASAATYTVAVADTACLEDTGDGSGALLLVERQRQCINIQSRAIHSWTNDNSATSLADTHVGPDGATTADSITFAATAISGKSKTQTAANVASSVNLAWQCWAKSGTGGDEKFKFRISDKSAAVQSSGDFTVNSGWLRFTYDIDSGPGAGNPVFRLLNASDAVGRGAGRVVVVAAICVEPARYPGSIILNESAGQNGKRYEDNVIYPAAQVPLALRGGKSTFPVRTNWANTELVSGEERWVYSFGGDQNGLRFRHTGTDVRLEALVGGAIVASSGAVTVARYGVLTLLVDCAAGILSVNGVAGATGSPIVWPGGVMLREGGIVGGDLTGTKNLDGAIGVALVAA